MNSRFLGTLCLVGGLAYVVMVVYSAITGAPSDGSDAVVNILGLVWAAGAICGWLGFILIRGTGDNIAVRFLSFVPVIGLSLALVLVLYSLATGSEPYSNPLLGMSLMTELIGIVLNTIFAIATRALPGWRKFAPLMVLAGFIVGGLVSGLTRGAVFGIPLGLGLGYAALGYAVQTAVPARHPAAMAA